MVQPQNTPKNEPQASDVIKLSVNSALAYSGDAATGHITVSVVRSRTGLLSDSYALVSLPRLL